MPVQTPEQRAAAYNAAGVPDTQPYTTPVAPPVTLAADSLKTPAQPYVVPTYTAPSSDYYKSLISSIPNAVDLASQKSAAQLDAAGSRSAITTKILDTLDKASQRTAAQQTAEANAGVPDLKKNLTDVTSQITALKNEAEAIPLQIQNDSEGRGRTAAGVAPLEASALHTNAIKALSLNSIAATLQGNLSLAQQEADRAVAAEFDPLQHELDYLKQVYSMNQDALSEADKEQAGKISAALQDRQDKLDAAKSDRASVMSLVSSAAQNGAPAAIISQALGLDLAAATSLLAPYQKETAQWSEPFNLGGDIVQKNLKTGEVRTAVNIPADGSGGVTFTQSQINNGAANAGLPIDSFKNLDADTKNFFINAFPTFTAQQKLIQSGERTAKEVAGDIQSSSSLSADTKRILLSILGVSAADASSGGNSGSGGFWSTVGSVLGGAAKAAGSVFGIN